MQHRNKTNITFVLFTFNEGKRIEYPIRCFLPYGDVLISDDTSTDNTVNIAKKLGARVIKRKIHGAPFVESKEEADFIYKHVNTEWVYWGFADTMAPKTCLDLYLKIARENKYKVTVQKLKTLLYDSHEYFGHLNVTTRFYRKDSINFSGNTIHQVGKFADHVKPSEVLYFPPLDEYSLYHFSTHTTEPIISSLNTFSSTQAHSTSPRLIFLKMLLWPLFNFLKIYFLDGGFRYGPEGFFVAVQYSLYPLVVYAKTYEISHNLVPESIENNFIKKKAKLLTTSPKSNILQKVIALIEVAFVSFLHKSYKFNQKKS